MSSKKKSSAKRAKQKNQLAYHMMVFPALIFLLIFHYIPMGGLVMAFQDYKPVKGIFGSDFVGLKYFKYMISLPEFPRIVRNTMFMAIMKVVLGTILAIAFAILLNEIRHKFMKKSIQTIVYLPHFLSWVVLATVVVNLFSLDGSINAVLQSIGLNKINFLGDTGNFPLLIIGTDVWKEFGYNSIVYLAAITAVDPGLHEAAAIDGASWWKRVWHVTIPGMLPIIMLMMAMNVTTILSGNFDQIYNLYSPLVYETGDVIDTYVYRIGLIGRQYSLGTAVGLMRSIIGTILLFASNRLSRKTTGAAIF